MKKRFLTLILTGILALSLTACGNNTEEAVEESAVLLTESAEAVEEEPEEVVEEQQTTAEIDLNAMGVTDVRDKNFTTGIYEGFYGGPAVQPLSFEDALIGLYQGDLDQDSEDELLLVKYQEYNIEGVTESVRTIQEMNLVVYENRDGEWEERAMAERELGTGTTSESGRCDVFIDDAGNIYIEEYGEAVYLADGMGYCLHQIAYDGEEININTINHYDGPYVNPTILECGGSDGQAYACTQFDTQMAEDFGQSDPEAYDFITQFIEDYRALGLEQTKSIDRDEATMEQNDHLTPICRIDIVPHLNLDAISAIYDNPDYDACGSIDVSVIDYCHVEAKNSGVPRTEGTRLEKGDVTSDGNSVDTDGSEATGYDEILVEVYQLLASGGTDDRHLGISDICTYSGAGQFDLAGYSITDMNGDGVDELLIISRENNPNTIYEYYTMVNGSVYKVFDGWYRNSYYLLTDGSIANVGSNGAASSGTFIFTVDGNGNQTFTECYFSDPNEDWSEIYFYYNTHGMWDASSSEQLDVTEDEGYELINSYENRLQYEIPCTSFAEYATGR